MAKKNAKHIAKIAGKQLPELLAAFNRCLVRSGIENAKVVSFDLALVEEEVKPAAMTVMVNSASGSRSSLGGCVVGPDGRVRCG